MASNWQTAAQAPVLGRTIAFSRRALRKLSTNLARAKFVDNFELIARAAEALR